MIIFLIGFVVAIFLANSWYYKYRVPKKTQDYELFNRWIDTKLTRRYKP